MNNIQRNLDTLDKLTKELADEIHNETNGHVMQLLCLIFDKLKTYCMIIRNDDTIIYINPSLAKYTKSHKLSCRSGMKWYEVWGMDKPKNDIAHKVAIKERKVTIQDYTSPITRNTFNITAIPLLYNGVSGTICLLLPKDGK